MKNPTKQELIDSLKGAILDTEYLQAFAGHRDRKKELEDRLFHFQFLIDFYSRSK